MRSHGVIERHDGAGRCFRDVDLAQLVAACDGCSAEEPAARIDDAVVHAFGTPLSDEVAIPVLRRTP